MAWSKGDAPIALAVGEKGVVAASFDQGKTWASATVDDSLTFTAVTALRDGFAATTEEGKVIRLSRADLQRYFKSPIAGQSRDDAAAPPAPTSKPAIMEEQNVPTPQPAGGKRAALGVSLDAGEVIQAVMPSSGAAKAGLQVGDAISGVDGQPVKQPTDIAAIVSHKSAGDKVSLTITRGEKQQTVTVILGQPQQQASFSPQQQAALHAMQISVDLNKAMHGKDFARARELLNELFRMNKEDGGAWYNLACVESLTGHTDKAIACLKKAFDYGYADFRNLERDTDLDAIRKLPQFKEFLAHKDQSQRARAAKIAEELRKSLGSDYLIEIDDENRLIFAANLDRQTLDEVKQKLTAQAKALWTDLFDNHFEQYETIVVASEKDADGMMGPSGGGYESGSHRLVAQPDRVFAGARVHPRLASRRPGRTRADSPSLDRGGPRHLQ